MLSVPRINGPLAVGIVFGILLFEVVVGLIAARVAYGFEVQRNGDTVLFSREASDTPGASWSVTVWSGYKGGAINPYPHASYPVYNASSYNSQTANAAYFNSDGSVLSAEVPLIDTGYHMVRLGSSAGEFRYYVLNGRWAGVRNSAGGTLSITQPAGLPVYPASSWPAGGAPVSVVNPSVITSASIEGTVPVEVVGVSTLGRDGLAAAISAALAGLGLGIGRGWRS